MQKIIEKSGKSFMIQSEASAFETGYGVYFKNDDGKRGSVQFGVLLSSSMELVSIPYKVNGYVSKADFDICKQVAFEELEANPNVFHIVENGRTERNRHTYALKQSLGFKHVTPSDPEVQALEQRIADLEGVMRQSYDWAHNPSKQPFKEFLAAYRNSTFETSSLPVPEEGAILAPMSPYDIVSYARELEVGSIVVIPTSDSLSRIPFAVADHSDYGWPLPWRFPEEETKWVHFHRQDFLKDARSERTKDILSKPDTLVLVWTRRTDRAAFERIASIIGGQDNDPRLLIGSPEGTVTGRANAIRACMEASPSLAPAI